MINPFFKNSDLWKPCFVYSNKSNVPETKVDFGAVKDMPNRPHPPLSEKEESPKEPGKKEEGQKGVPEGADAGKLQKKPKPRKERARQRKIQRTKEKLDEAKERLGFSPEHLTAVRKAIGADIENIAEVPKLSDRLHAFVLAHREYGTGKNSYRQWNEDFCTTFGLPVEKGKDKHKEYKKYVSALQYYLGHHFNEHKAKDVFEVKKGKRANPFVYMDGKMGGYTMSVLGEYWNHKFHPLQKEEKKKDKLKHSDLDKNFKKRGNNEKIYKKALADLNKKLHGVEPATFKSKEKQKKAPKKTFKLKEIAKLTTEELEKVIAEAKKDEKLKKAYTAAVEKYRKEKNLFSGQEIPKDKLDKLNRAFLKGLGPEAYEKLAKAVGLMVEGKPEPAPVAAAVSPEAAIVAGVAGIVGGPIAAAAAAKAVEEFKEKAPQKPKEVKKAPPKPPEIVKFDELPKAQQEGVAQLLEKAQKLADKKAMDSFGWMETLAERKSELVEEAQSFNKKRSDKMGANPEGEIDVDIIDEDYMRTSAWPRKAYDRWVKLYKELEVMDSRFMDPNKVEAKKKDVDQAFTDYQESLTQYFKKEEAIAANSRKELQQNILQEFAKYSFSSDIDASTFILSDSVRLPEQLRKKLERKVPHTLFRPRPTKKHTDHLDAKRLLKTYLTSVPLKVFNTGDYDTFRASIKEGKQHELSQVFAKYEKLSGSKKVDVIDIFNLLIYLNNIDQFANKLKYYVNRSYPVNYRLALDKIDKEPFDKMLARVRKARTPSVG